ncbi:hypothetical protein [Mycobacterium montefiorense]|uniref:TIGR02611 family protein n=1 Tax=Mycobacterium montefiorense TaxID=154654 RepID=A0AA37PK47_9MYCO|nr:hypothetical protein [Mycobacterium montefiorense]GBG39036.1 hypothetical protein MmonteBS_34080 [Mycobacterium montefiorense]GKU32824.1 hypothetical protein NJB14191_01710 [Mycobacterium montefiorense]GKU38345.1 hypothetical protein NJB14192_03430 [Mycobacterium montefiorense]GKU47259.1 hypothetical protein NJB14194_38770 [Mycobacterium montefiorense]GKU50375.1 hypothetical protein NJB14195_16210 [Mycobacterium montefiorense]
MDTRDQHPQTRDDALARVLANRTRGQARAMPIRAGLAVLGGVLLVASIPLTVLLPEFGIPALLIAFRLLAVEAMWAARAYAWTDWRFTQMQHWFHRQSRVVRMVIVAGLILLAVAIVVVFVYEFV